MRVGEGEPVPAGGTGYGGAGGTGAIVELLGAVERFCRRRKPELGGEELGDELIRLRQACDLLELEFSEMVGEFALTDEYDRQGSASAIDWIRHNCKMSGHAASDRICVGRRIESLPLSAEAMAAGEIGFGHLGLIARTAAALVESGSARPFDEENLLAAARESSVGRFRYVCQHLRHAADREGLAAEQAEAGAARRLEMLTCEDGMVVLRGLLDPVGGAVLRTALEPLARRSGESDDRPRRQRLADSLVELADHALDSGRVPQRAGQRAHLQVTASLETLLGKEGSPAGELEFSSPISYRTVERLACDASVTRILLGPGSAVVDVGRSRRVVPGSTRRALNARDGGCRWPGCERPASWSAAHHLVHWARGGDTDLANLVLLCRRHHWMVHEGGWLVALAADGRLVTVPPPLPGLAGLARGPGDLAA